MGRFRIRTIEPRDREWVRHFVVRHWRSETLVSRGRRHEAPLLDGAVADGDHGPVGLVLWNHDADALEVVLLQVVHEGRGLGAALLDAARRKAAALGCRRLWLVTTNDNLHAIEFYLRRGLRLVAIHRGAVADARKLKPEIPLAGAAGVPIEDEVEFEWTTAAVPSTLPFSQFDTRGYRTLDVADGYAAWAGDYDETVEEELDLSLLSELRSVPWSSAHLVADLACGTGRVAGWLAARGNGRLHGVDRSEAMLRRAATKGVYELLARADLVRTPLPPAAYDLVTSSLAACHLERLDGLYAEAARLLGPAGRFVLLDYHPFFLIQGIPTHFRGPDGEPIAIDNAVHLLSGHVQEGRAAGLALVEMRERIVDKDWSERRPGIARHLGKPVSFALVWQVRT